ncbi:hypothetical protein [Candidatus Brachybacter algidus]|nr:hypothetical protein [Candidatus Brachybacter algidus]
MKPVIVTMLYSNFKVYFNLQYQNASDSFNVYQANNELGTFAYA